MLFIHRLTQVTHGTILQRASLINVIRIRRHENRRKGRRDHTGRRALGGGLGQAAAAAGFGA
jgi:hypothetical protein